MEGHGNGSQRIALPGRELCPVAQKGRGEYRLHPSGRDQNVQGGCKYTGICPLVPGAVQRVERRLTGRIYFQMSQQVAPFSPTRPLCPSHECGKISSHKKAPGSGFFCDWMKQTGKKSVSRGALHLYADILKTVERVPVRAFSGYAAWIFGPPSFLRASCLCDTDKANMVPGRPSVYGPYKYPLPLPNLHSAGRTF